MTHPPRPPSNSPRDDKRTAFSVLREEWLKFIEDVVPHVRREAATFVKMIATTLRKSVHVLILIGLGYATSRAFDLPKEDRIEAWFWRAGVVVVGVAFVHDLWKTYFQGNSE